MKYFKKTILYKISAVLVVFSVLLTVFLSQPKSTEAGLCAVTDAYFLPVATAGSTVKDGVLNFNFPASTNPKIKAVIATTGCEKLPLQIEIGPFEGEYIVPDAGTIEFIFKPTEKNCSTFDSPDCTHKITVISGTTTLFNSETHKGTGVNTGYVLTFECSGTACSLTPSPWTLISNTGKKVSDACVIKDATFYTILGPSPLDLRVAENPELEVKIETTGCIGWQGKMDFLDDNPSTDNHTFIFDQDTDNITRVALIAGEAGSGCNIKVVPNCNKGLTITPKHGGSDGDEFYMTKPEKRIDYHCAKSDACDDKLFWQVDLLPPGTPLNKKFAVGSFSAKAGCSVTSTEFDPSFADGSFAENNNYYVGTTTKEWSFYEASRDEASQVLVTIKTKDCAGGSIYVDIVSNGGEVNQLYSPINVLHGRQYVIPSSEEFTIKLVAGEEKCNERVGPDCEYYINTYTTPEAYKAAKSGVYLSKGKARGRLAFECDNICNTSWKYAGDTSQSPYKSEVLDTTATTLVDDGTSSLDPECIGSDGKAIPKCYKLYSGLSEIFDKVLKNKISNVSTLGDFINAIISLVIGIAGVITVGLIMWDGFTYWQAGKGGDTAALGAVKGRIWKRLLGLLLLFTIYTILRTINPDLLNLTPRINPVELLTASQASLSSNDYTAITGEPLKSPSEYDALAKDVAKKYSSDYCALRVIIQNESAGNPNVVGQDENVRNAGIPSRVAFINSTKKYSGATFTKSDALITQKGFCNDAAGCKGSVPNPSSKSLGLDWRFTKGIGLTQITFFPSDYDKFKDTGYVPPYTNKDTPPSRTFNFSTGKMTVTPSEVFKPEKNLEISAKLWNEGIKKCSTPQGAFYTYACGGCDCSSNAFAKTEVSERTSQYNQCKKENP